MRKVDVLRPPINYVVLYRNTSQVAWFIVAEDAQTFIDGFGDRLGLYEIAEARR